ncbi:MAG: translation initiation factor IF-2 [Candidatus Omnitrophota bacterium]|nr:translation initiation factor IF-2 [Candidatus Omnitrophota bacterium]
MIKKNKEKNIAGKKKPLGKIIAAKSKAKRVPKKAPKALRKTVAKKGLKKKKGIEKEGHPPDTSTELSINPERSQKVEKTAVKAKPTVYEALRQEAARRTFTPSPVPKREFPRKSPETAPIIKREEPPKKVLEEAEKEPASIAPKVDEKPSSDPSAKAQDRPEHLSRDDKLRTGPEPAEGPAPEKEGPNALVDSGPAAENIVTEEVSPQEAPKLRVMELDLPIALKELAAKIGVRPNELIIELMSKNVFATITQNLGEDIVKSLLVSRGIEFKKPPKAEDQIMKEHKQMEAEQDIKHLTARAPVVTFMGHVDHGKTSLLDFIRKTRVAEREKGGITQHIGAYEVKFKQGSVTFLDTPGHEAFTAMRARGANATDIVVLVVAADDGVMPQTKEALDHARAAGVTIVVAINKCDLPGANLDKVKGQLSQVGLTSEDWGGKTICVPVSAKTGEGIEHLLEMLLLEAELLELKANTRLRARGVVIEGKLSSGQGPVATLLVKNGTLKLGDMIVTGMHYGRIKAIMDHMGKRVDSAPPSKPVTMLGLSGVPMSGDEFFVVRDERKARTLSLLKQDEDRNRRLKSTKRVTLEDFYAQMKEGVTKELTILLKGDVQGSVEALQKSLKDLNTKDVKIDIVHVDVGNISESDIMLAMASKAVVIGFNVRLDEGAEAIAAKEGIEVKLYGIIYEAIEDVRAAMEGLLEPVLKEQFVGRAQVKQVFKVSKVGTIAGSYVVKGKIPRSGVAKLIRDKQVVYQGKIASLKRFKDDIKEASEGLECGIGLERHDDIKIGDLIEIYQIEKVARRLEAKK